MRVSLRRAAMITSLQTWRSTSFSREEERGPWERNCMAPLFCLKRKTFFSPNTPLSLSFSSMNRSGQIYWLTTHRTVLHLHLNSRREHKKGDSMMLSIWEVQASNRDPAVTAAETGNHRSLGKSRISEKERQKEQIGLLKVQGKWYTWVILADILKYFPQHLPWKW